MGKLGLPIWDRFNNERISKPKVTSQTFIRREIKQIVSFINIVLSPGQNYICVENKITNNVL